MTKNDDKDLTITITSGTIIKTVFILALFYFIYLFSDLVLVILTAVVIASAIEPATRWLGRYRIPRTPAVIIIYLFTISTLIGVSFLLVRPIVEDIASLDTTYQFSSTLSGYVGTDGANIVKDLSLRGILGELRNLVSGTPETAIKTLGTVSGGVLGFVLIIVFSFYLAVQEHGVVNFLRIIIPDKHEDYAIHLWKRTQKKMGLWMQGQLVLSFIVGVLVYLGLALMQIPYALSLAVVAAFFEVIPIFGPVLAAVPAVILGAVHGVAFAGAVDLGLASGLVVALFYVIIQQFENHLIYPLVVRKVIGVPPLMVIIALVIGAQAAGILGIILAVPAAIVLMEFADDIQKNKSLAKNKA